MSPVSPTRPCTRPGCRHVQPCPDHPRRAHVGQTYADRKLREPWAKLYDTQRWRRARLAFLREHPLCVACWGPSSVPGEGAQRLTLATTVDHIVPHRGDEQLFWDEGNWQALCAPCHSAKTKKEVIR